MDSDLEFRYLEFLHTVPTRYLQEELSRRDGIESFVIGSYVPVEVYAGDERILETSGPCTITHNYD